MNTCTDCGRKRPERSRGIRKCLACAAKERGEKLATRPFIELNGIRHYRDKQGWRASRCKGHKRLHTVIWEDAHGPVPAGYHLFCSDQERPSLSNIECRPAYAGMAEWRTKLHTETEAIWRDRLARVDLAERPTRPQIAQQAGASVTAAKRWCSRLKVPKARMGRKPGSVHDERIRELYGVEPTQAAIAKVVGVSQITVSRRIRAMGLKPYLRGRRSPNLQREEARP